MTLDRHAAERRRFARLLGVDDELGSGLPIGAPNRGAEDRPEHDRDRDDRAQASLEADSETKTETETQSVSVPSSATEDPT